MVSKDAKIHRLERELIRLRSSPSLRLGAHLTDAMRKPWLAIFLPITLPWAMLMLGLEMLGKKAPPPTLERVTQDPSLEERNCVVIFPTNGVGFGHFTRMLALAKQMKLADSKLEIIFFSTMPTLHLLKPYGIPAHHVSGPKFFDGMTTEEWNGLLEEQLAICLEAHRPKKFIFDGAFPYRGMLRAIKTKPDVEKIWVRRSAFRRGKSVPVDSVEHFDLIVHPEDSISRLPSEIEHNVSTITCPPITLLNSEEMMNREVARRRLKLPLDVIVAYVQIGAGEINDINSEVRLTIDALTNHEDVHVVLGESMLGERFDFDLPRVHLLRDYPNSMYFPAFDISIQAGGYNSFHEMRNFGMPTLFYPNLFTGMDDQLARCNVAVEEGWGAVLKERNSDTINLAISELLEEAGKRNPRGVENGSISLASEILSR